MPQTQPLETTQNSNGTNTNQSKTQHTTWPHNGKTDKTHNVQIHSIKTHNLAPRSSSRLPKQIKLTTCIQSKRTTWPHGAHNSVDKTHDYVGLIKLTTYIFVKASNRRTGNDVFQRCFSKGPSRAMRRPVGQTNTQPSKCTNNDHKINW